LNKILIIDDDKALCQSLEIQLQGNSKEITSVHSIKDGLNSAQILNPALILLDMHLPDRDGVDSIPDFLLASPLSVIIIMTGDPDNMAATRAMSLGAFDYLRKPFDKKNLMSLIEKGLQHQHIMEQREDDSTKEESDELNYKIVGSHPNILELHKRIGLLSRSRVTVLIEGESGTGKELVARILHNTTKPDKPFVAINCSAMVATLLESDLFGHEKGAFTGADKRKTGKLEYAENGSVFLDEIGDMPLELQGKLLRVIQEDEFVPVGGLQPIPLSARIIAATHHNLQEAIKKGTFRMDLYYRLAVSKLEVPPLRTRQKDIPDLVEYLLERLSHKFNRDIKAIDDTAMEQLMSYLWPGNVRELENVLTRAVAFTSSSVLTSENFDIQSHKRNKNFRPETTPLAEVEKNHIEKSLLLNNWNISKTARALDISPTTLRKKINDYQIVALRRKEDQT
jgi:two-component system, NtrC family, response regulator AtoC